MGWQDDTILSSATSAPDAVPALQPQKSNLWDSDPILASAEQLPEVGPRVAEGAIESIQSGYQASVGGLFWRGKLPELVMDPEHAKWWERALSGISQVGMDIPVMGLGGAFGGAAGTVAGTAIAPGPGTAIGGVLGAGAGMFGTPALMREILIAGYQSGEIKTAADFWNALRDMSGHVATETAKEAAIGAFTFGSGGVAARTAGKAILPAIGQKITAATAIKAIGAADTAAQIATMVSLPAALQGRIPDAQEFMDAAIVIGGLKLAVPLSERITRTFVKTGKTPAEQVADAKEHPEIAKEMRSEAEERQAREFSFKEQLTKQEELWSLQSRLVELERKASGTPETTIPGPEGKPVTRPAELPTPLTDAERVERDALRIKVDAIEAETVKAEVPRETIPTGFSPEQLAEARDRAAARIAELTTREGATPLTDAERVERIGLVNALSRPEELARRFEITPERRIPTADERAASAQRVFDDVVRQLEEVDAARKAGGLEPLGDEHAQAVAALVRARVQARAERLGRLPEDIYTERPLKIRDQLQGGEELPGEPVPPEAPRFPSPEVDLFGNKLEPEMQLQPQHAAKEYPVVKVPLADIKLSTDVPQFKAGADAKGVVEPLRGEVDLRGVPPVALWERLSGDLELISGRHRVDLWKRKGMQTIDAQIFKESEGFDVRQATMLDAEMNIRDEHGRTSDYVNYFKNSGISEERAESRGLLGRAKGREGFRIAHDAIPELIAAHRAGLLSDDAALAISQTAPGSERLQVMGIAMVNKGKSIQYATNMMRSLDLMASERAAAGQQIDIFNFDDSAMIEAAAMAKKALSAQRHIAEQISAVNGAAKRPELAREMGVNVEDPEGIKRRIAELRQEQYQWDNWPLYPELVARLRGEGTFFQTAERPEFDLKAETPAEAAVRDAEAAAAAKRKIAQEKEGVKGPAQTVDQADMFAFQRTLFQGKEQAEPFYSQLRNSIQEAPDRMFSTGKATASWLEANAAKMGIKKEEIYWSGITDWMNAQGKVNKAEVLAYLDANGVRVEEKTLFQGKGQERDGEHLGSYTVAENLITTFKNANKSTIVHELGHSWLEEMKVDARLQDAPAQIRADWEVLRREFAIGETGEISTASHEQFAKTFERYLAEGKAPSIGLRGVFERFKAWMLEVYKSLTNIGAEINPEVRDVFDRMLATDREIADARELGVPRAYVDLARKVEAEKIIPEARKIEPGAEAEQARQKPFADELPPGPGEAPDNIHVNYKYINSPMDVKLAMQRMAEIDQRNIQRQRGGKAGVESWAEEQAKMESHLLDTLGGGEDKLGVLRSGLNPGDPKVNHRLRAMNQLMEGAARDSARLRDIVLEAGHDATVRQQLEYMGSIERARMLQAEFLGERAAVARAMNALKDVTEGSGEIGRMLDVIGYGEKAARELYQTKRTPAEEQAHLKAQLDAIMLNYRGQSVLDIAKLHKEIGSLKGSYGFSKKVLEATTWEKLVEGWKSFLLSGPVTHTTNFFGTEAFHWLQPAVDVLAATIGMARGASPGMGETDRASMSEAIGRMSGMLSGVQDGLKVGIAAMRTGEGTGKTESYREAIPGRAGHIIRTPLRMMGAEDAMVTTMYERGELRTLAIRQAFNENLNPKTEAFAKRVQYLTDHPTPEIETKALATATRMTFNTPYGEKGLALANFINKWSLQWMIPFTRTPINIALEMLRLSPFAPGVEAWRADFAKGGAARDRALAEVTLGVGIASLTMAYAFSGSITGAGSPDPGKNRTKEGVWQPYSIFINGKWYEYSRIQPVGTLMGMAADMSNIWDHMTDEEKDKLPKMISTAFANAITNQTFLQGITNFVNALSDPTQFGPTFLERFAGTAVPNIVAQPAAMMDPHIREVNGMFEAIQARIPGWREGLLPSRDWLGEPRASKERVGVIMPVRTLEPSEDKVRLEAARLNLSMAAPPRKTHIGKGTGKIGDVPLTPEERDIFAKVGGEMTHQILTNIVNAPGYDEMPDLVKRKIFAQVVSASHRVAAVAALPPEKRTDYLQQITERMQAELAPGEP